jgi:hypothetical protein
MINHGFIARVVDVKLFMVIMEEEKDDEKFNKNS